MGDERGRFTAEFFDELVNLVADSRSPFFHAHTTVVENNTDAYTSVGIYSEKTFSITAKYYHSDL